MFSRDAINKLTSDIASLLPDDIRQLQDDLESNIRALLQDSLSKMNLVTREEFDVQTEVLQRTREKLDRLEKQLDQKSRGQTR
jgi:BMFP domain-containing protein YqiC